MIPLLITLLIFCLIAYVLYWICLHFQLPKPVWWILALILVLILISILLRQVNLPPLLR